MVSLNDGNGVTRHRNLTAKLDETSKALLAKQKTGDIFTIKSITITNDGIEVKVPSLIL